MSVDASCYTRRIDFDSLPPLVRALPPAPDPDALLEGFVDFTLDQGIELYPAQEEAILELLAGNHVILNTPTGSGKSMVAAAAHYAALAADKVSVYTAPIKALVSEKFFALCRDFGTERVGMITGDASVNPEAPIICCTAEILANWALRDGAETPVDTVIVDEFHYYADPQRGWAWQIPLLELPNAQFLLMSATLGNTDKITDDLERRTGREVALVTSAQRPVPLDFEYRRTTLHASITELLERDRAPIYLVHFTQREATEAAQGYLSLDPLSIGTSDGGKANKARIRDAIGGFRFDSPIGKDLRRYLMGGIGVHHAGLLPKYRLLVEKLAQEGLLKIICGTDTLGVGVNVPIRSVLFTQLYKYDGTSTRTLNVREFQQIAGRAGRKGFDDRGTVWVQAPEHVVENLRAEAKAAEKGKKKVVKKKQPDDRYAHWTEDTFTKLIDGSPSPMRSSFGVTHQMVMSLLDRPRSADGTDGCDAVRRLMTDNHEPRRRQRAHIRRSVAIYRSLVEAELLEFPDEPDELGRRVRVNFDLQDDFALHQPLSLWALVAIEERLAEQDAAEADDDLPLALDLLTIIESILEQPGVIIAAQVNLAKSEAMAEMKAAGVEYEERMDRLAEIEPPKPNAEWLYESFDRWRVSHPWVGSDNVRPKSVVRDLYEQAMTFGEFVNHYGLKRSEGVVLRYLSDVYKALRQNIPDAAATDDLDDLIEWLGVLVRQVDSSLIDEWEAMTNPEPTDGSATDEPEEIRPPTADDITANPRAFRTMVRNRVWRWVENLAFKRNYAELFSTNGSDLEEIVAAMAPYWETYDSIGVDGDARSGARFTFDAATGAVTQILADPDGHDEWRLSATVDLEASRAEGRAVVVLDAIGGVPAG
ncbi:MAG: DEAD/DEAH box helicase [Acidimicrobiales bacterium]